jgi:hypothetical protein
MVMPMIEQFLNRDYMLAVAAAVTNGVAREAEASPDRSRLMV